MSDNPTIFDLLREPRLFSKLTLPISSDTIMRIGHREIPMTNPLRLRVQHHQLFFTFRRTVSFEFGATHKDVDFYPLIYNYMYIKYIQRRVVIGANVVFDSKLILSGQHMTNVAYVYLSKDLDVHYGRDRYTLPHQARDLTLENLDSFITHLCAMGHTTTVLECMVAFFSNYAYDSVTGVHLHDYMLKPVDGQVYPPFATLTPRAYLSGQYRKAAYSSEVAPDLDQVCRLFQVGFETRCAIQLAVDFKYSSHGVPFSNFANTDGKDTSFMVGKYPTIVDQANLVFNPTVNWDLLFDHVASHILGSGRLGDIFLPYRAGNAMISSGVFPLHLFSYFGPRYLVFNPRRGTHCMPSLRERKEIGPYHLLDEKAISSLLLFAPTLRPYFFRKIMEGADYRNCDEIQSCFIDYRYRGYRAVKTRSRITYHELATLKLIDCSLIDFINACSEAVGEDRTNVNRLIGDWVVKDNIQWRGHSIKSFLPGDCFPPQERYFCRQQILDKFPQFKREDVEYFKKGSDGEPLQYDYRTFFSIIASRCLYTETDRAMSDYHVDLARRYEEYTTFNPVDFPKVWYTHDTIRRMFNFFLNCTDPAVCRYQVLHNFLVYATYCELSWRVAFAFARLGFFRVDGKKRREIVDLYDEYLIRFKTCPLTDINMEGVVGISGSMIGVCAWGYDPVTYDEFDAAMDNLRNVICVAGDPRFSEPGKIDEDYKRHSIGEIINAQTGEEYGDDLLKKLIKAATFRGKNPESIDFTFRNKTCPLFIPEMLDLYRAEFDHYKDAIVPAIKRRLSKWGDIDTPEYRSLLWLRVGTGGAAVPLQSSKYLVQKKQEFRVRRVYDLPSYMQKVIG